VRVQSTHPDGGATGEVVNAFLYPDGREIVFVHVPGGEGRYCVEDLTLAPRPEGPAARGVPEPDAAG